MTDDDLQLIITATIEARMQCPSVVDIRAIEVGEGATRVRVEFGPLAPLLPDAGPRASVPESALGALLRVDRERADMAPGERATDDVAPEHEPDDLDLAHLDDTD